MTIQQYSFELKLSIKTPFLSHKAGAQQFGYDMSMLRNQAEQPVFLGSHIRGHLKHTLMDFEKKPDLNEESKQQIKSVLSLLGKASGNEEYNPPEQTDRLNFDFFWVPAEETTQTLKDTQIARYRIGINESTGTVAKSNLQVIENYKQGQTVCFHGEIKARLTEEQAKNCKKWLLKAARYLPAIGALRGTGFGKISEAALTSSHTDQKKPENQPSLPDRIGLIITSDRPICIAQPHIPDHNRFISEDFIAGNVIIGSIARHYPEHAQQDQQAWLNQLIIRHARPCPIKNQNNEALSPIRTQALPLSLVSGIDDIVFDIAAIKPETGKSLLLKHKKKYIAPCYQPDWKEKIKQQAQKSCKIESYEAERQLIVRTAIEAGTNQAKDSQLFSYDCISPHNTQWCTDIDFSLIKSNEDKEQAKQAIQQIIHDGLPNIGKTKARLKLEITKPFTPETTKIDPINGYYIVVLQTAARMFQAPNDLKASANQKQLFERYQSYWQHISDNQLRLSHHYSQQTKVGGEFIRHYYKQKNNYQPIWLTQPGSVFILEASPNTIKSNLTDRLKKWQQQGLPTAEGISDYWKNNPYLRQNGFAEVRINESIHTEQALAKQQAIKGVWK